jgi:hypothetical protein
VIEGINNWIGSSLGQSRASLNFGVPLRAPPYNNGVNLTNRGRHALCSGRSKQVSCTAKVTPVPLRTRPSRPGAPGHAWQVTPALYGLSKNKKEGLNAK